MASNPEFVLGNVHTGFIEQHNDALFPKAPGVSSETLCQASLSLLLLERSKSGKKPFDLNTGFRVNLPAQRTVTVKIDNTDQNIVVEYIGKHSHTASPVYKMTVNDKNYEVDGSLEQIDDSYYMLHAFVNGHSRQIKVVLGEKKSILESDEINLFWSEGNCNLSLPAPEHLKSSLTTGSSGLSGAVAPMTGTIEKIMVSEGQEVKEGEALVIMIAMKMEHTIRAPQDGVIEKVLYEKGETAERYAKLVKFQANE